MRKAKAVLPQVEIGVAVVMRGRAGPALREQLLLVYNPEWGCFTLPMSKLREWRDPGIPKADRREAPIEAAARAAAQYLGRTCMPDAQPLPELRGYQQSDRDGKWKSFNFHMFRIALDETAPEVSVPHEWLGPIEILDERRRPISRTARELVALLQNA